MLNYLLTQEIYEDEENKVREQSDLLGGVQRNLIKSITAISAPHNGTTLTEVVTKTIPFIQYFVGVAGVVGTQFYNFDLDQWGFNRKEDETRASYINRMRTHDAWQTKNMSSWDLSLDGAQELNGPDPIVEYDENELLIPGQWYWIKVYPMDHWNIIGHLGSKERMEAARMVLKAHGNRLKTLPPN